MLNEFSNRASRRTAAELDWSYRIKKNLGDKFRRRSETDRAQFQADEQKKHQADDAFIQDRHV
jgi:hypothetical protein